MTSNNDDSAASEIASHITHGRKQSVRRIIPAIPRQLTRPRLSVSAPKQVPSAATPPDESLTTTQPPRTVRGEDGQTKNNVAPELEQESDALANGPISGTEQQEAVLENTDRASAVPGVLVKVDNTGEAQIGGELYLAQAVCPKMILIKAHAEIPRAKVDTPQAPMPIKKPADSLRRLNTKGARMPPPFYPARDVQQQSRPAIAAPTTFHPQSHPVPAVRPSHHISQPSTDSIVFGSFAESANASPIPPGTAGSAFAAPPGTTIENGSAAHPMSGQVVPQSASNHFYPSQYPPPDTRYDHPHPQQLYQHFVPPVVPSHLSGPPNTASAFPRPAHLNGHPHLSRSPSQTSSGVAEPLVGRNGDSGIGTPDAPIPRQDAARYTPQTSSSQHSIYPADDDLKNIHDLRAYLLSQFGSLWFADYILQLSRTNDAEPVSIPAHGFLLARSPGLNLLLPSAIRDDNSRQSRLHIPRTFYFREPNAFVEALRFLYGGESLDPNRFLRNLPPPNMNSLDTQIDLGSRMNYILSYVAANHSMRLAAPAFHGAAIAGQLLRWETIETCLFFVLDGGFSASGMEFAYGEAAIHVLQQTIAYVSLNFPTDFALETAVQELVSIPRLPERTQTFAPSVLPQTRAKRGSRLGSIQFGDTHIIDSTQVPFVTAVLSSVLLSVPFQILQSILEHPALRDRLGDHSVVNHMRSVVAEREKRRLAALRAHQHSGSNTINDATSGDETVQNMFWEEAVEPSPDPHGCGYALVRRHMQHSGA
ncbi:hypothetical protein MBLNU459_g7225t1 [Dothideomycetes sp. NU459]